MVNFCRLPPSANSSYTSSLFFARTSWWTSTPISTLTLSIQGPRYSRIVDALYSSKDVQGIDTSQHGFKHYLWLAKNCHWLWYLWSCQHEKEETWPDIASDMRNNSSSIKLRLTYAFESVQHCCCQLRDIKIPPQRSPTSQSHSLSHKIPVWVTNTLFG